MRSRPSRAQSSMSFPAASEAEFQARNWEGLAEITRFCARKSVIASDCRCSSCSMASESAFCRCFDRFFSAAAGARDVRMDDGDRAVFSASQRRSFPIAASRESISSNEIMSSFTTVRRKFQIYFSKSCNFRLTLSEVWIFLATCKWNS